MDFCLIRLAQFSRLVCFFLQVQVFLLMEQELTADEDITRYSLFKSVAILNILAVLSFRFCLRSRILFSLRHYGWFCVLNSDVVSGISPGPQVPRLQGLRQHTQGATASLPPTTASAGLTSTCLPASCWTWPSLCPLRVCLSFRCGCPYTFLHTECLKCILVQGSNISCWNVME